GRATSGSDSVQTPNAIAQSWLSTLPDDQASNGAPHVSVLLEPLLELLQPRPGVGFRALDCTVGAGGHSAALLERSTPDGRLVGLDADAGALDLARER